jgi:hypothetical protein
MEWRSRIVGHDDVAPDQLLAHPENFRRHPNAQRDALRGSLNSLGWVKGVLVNRRTGHVIDGHARVEEALSAGAATVPVDYVDLSPDEERLALAVLDPITEMATRDQEALDALLAQIAVEDDDLREFIASLGTEEPLGEVAAGLSAVARATLAERFGVPPFTVLNSTQGYWTTRKRAWIALGIKSELGRGLNTEVVDG